MIMYTKFEENNYNIIYIFLFRYVLLLFCFGTWYTQVDPLFKWFCSPQKEVIRGRIFLGAEAREGQESLVMGGVPY
jgi:hypothetical protein